MTLAQVDAVLKGTGLPVVYHQWRQNNARGPRPPLPRIAYQVKNDNPFYADGVVYYTCPAIEAALYTAEKDTALEAAVDTRAAKRGDRLHQDRGLGGGRESIRNHL